MAVPRVVGSVTPFDEVEDFETFWRREHKAVLTLAVALCGDWAAAEDLTQEAFLSADRAWDRIISPSAWVRRVLLNRAASRRRRLAREAAALLRLGARPQPVVVGGEHDEFWEAVRSLPPGQARVVVLYYLEDRSVADIAEVLQIAEGTVKASLWAARQALARQLSLEEEL